MFKLKSVVLAVGAYSISAIAAVAGSSQTQQTTPHVAVEAAFRQGGLPIQLNRLASTSEAVFDHIQVKNVMPRAIKAIVFGAAIYDVNSNSNAPAMILRGEPIETNIQFLAEQTISLKFVSWAELRSHLASLGVTSAVADLGVPRIEFEGGGKYLYDAEAKGGFRSKPEMATVHASAAQICGPSKVPKLVATAAEAQRVTPFGFFTSVNTDSCIYCTNSGQNCTVSACDTGQTGCSPDCPKQT